MGHIGQPLRRREDPRLLTGADRYAGDLASAVEDALCAAGIEVAVNEVPITRQRLWELSRLS